MQPFVNQKKKKKKPRLLGPFWTCRKYRKKSSRSFFSTYTRRRFMRANSSTPTSLNTVDESDAWKSLVSAKRFTVRSIRRGNTTERSDDVMRSYCNVTAIFIISKQSRLPRVAMLSRVHGVAHLNTSHHTVSGLLSRKFLTFDRPLGNRTDLEDTTVDRIFLLPSPPDGVRLSNSRNGPSRRADE